VPTPSLRLVAVKAAEQAKATDKVGLGVTSELTAVSGHAVRVERMSPAELKLVVKAMQATTTLQAGEMVWPCLRHSYPLQANDWESPKLIPADRPHAAAPDHQRSGYALAFRVREEKTGNPRPYGAYS
jgi:hypothetical protein